MKVLSNYLQSKIITLINTNVSTYINKNVIKKPEKRFHVIIITITSHCNVRRCGLLLQIE